MRRKDENLREGLLELARQMVETQGPQSLTIRALAQQAGVASGTVYNYFESKDEILLCLTQAHWQSILTAMQKEIYTGSFVCQLGEMYQFLRRSVDQSAGALMGSLGQVRPAGQSRMQAMQQVLQKQMVQRMQKDETILPQVWTEAFTQQDFADFLLVHLVALLQRNAENIDTLQEVAGRILYQKE